MADRVGDGECALQMVGAAEALAADAQLESTADAFWKPALATVRQRVDATRLEAAIAAWSRVRIEDVRDAALKALAGVEQAAANQESAGVVSGK